MGQPRSTLVCFASKEEARHFLPFATSRPHLRTLITGMGRLNAEKAILGDLAQARPALVLSCGFAGGLAPELDFGTVVFNVDSPVGIESALLAAGGVPGRFACVDVVLATAARKRALRIATGAAAVEMESGAIRLICREKGISSGTVRVILDTASEDLPLDFNLVLNFRMQIDGPRLAAALIRSPSKIKGLIKLQKKAATAARKLAEVLEKALGS